MQQDAFSVRDGIDVEAFGVMDCGREVDIRDRMSDECVQELERGGGEIWDKFFVSGGVGKCGAEAGGKFVGKKGVRFP